jgi:hypothetical protein
MSQCGTSKMHPGPCRSSERMLSAGTTSGFGKGKEKVVTSGSIPKEGSWSPPKDIRASTESTAPSEEKRRLIHSDVSSLSE